MKKIAYLLLFSIFFTVTYPIKIDHKKLQVASLACAIGTIVTPSIIRYLHPAEYFEPTLQNIYAATIMQNQSIMTDETIYDYMESFRTETPNKVQNILISKSQDFKVTVKQGVDCLSEDSNQPIFIFSPYYYENFLKHPKKLSFYFPGAPGRAIYNTGYYLLKKIVPSQTIMFEYRDTLAGLNGGQAIDQKCLKLITDEVIKQNKNFVLFGVCRGSLTILNALTKLPKEYIQQNTRAVILEGVPLSFKDAFEQPLNVMPVIKWLPQKLTSALLGSLVKLALPNVCYQNSDVLEKLGNIPPNLPILIVHLKGDFVVNDENTKKLLISLLKSDHKNIHFLLFEDKDIDHNSMAKAEIYPYITNAFLQRYLLPHDHDLAEKGKILLPNTIIPLQCPLNLSVDNYIETLWENCAVNQHGKTMNQNLRKKNL